MGKGIQGLVSPDQIAKASEGLKAAIDERKARSRSTRIDALRVMEQIIREARAARFSHARIASTLTLHGMRVTKHDVADFCREVLSEEKRPRRKRRRSRRTHDNSVAIQSRAMDLPKVDKPRSTQGRAVDPKPTGKSQPEKKPKEVGTKPLGRPGFRVPDDEDL